MSSLLDAREALKRRLLHDLNTLHRGDLHVEAVRDIQQDVFLAYGVNAEEHQDLARDVLYEAIGFGPLLPLMTDPTVSEIMVNGPHDVFVERYGRNERSSVTFEGTKHLRYLVQRLLQLTPGKRLDEQAPMVDLSLPDGSRVNIVVPPAAVGGPKITIRKWFQGFQALEDLIHVGSLDGAMASFLSAAVYARQTVLVSGAAGSGKSTLAQVLGRSFDPTDRIVVIEDTYELQFGIENQIRLLTREANIEGAGGISIRELFRNSLRMTPDRIILGEIRGGEAFDFLQAVTSGHRGSIGIIHASSPIEALYRLVNLAAQAGLPVPMSVLRQQAAAGIDLVVQIDRDRDGVRRISHVSEVASLDEGGDFTVNELFRFVPQGLAEGHIQGSYVPTGVKPAMLERLALAGAPVDPAMFGSAP
jgi:pilus assembly protein CpaF